MACFIPSVTTTYSMMGIVDAFTEPHFARSALVSIDVQRDVLDGQPLEIAGTSAGLPAMERIVGAFREAQRPIVHIVRLYLADGSNAELCRRSALQRGAQMVTAWTEGAEIAQGLLARPSIRLDTQLLLSGGIQSVGDREVIIFKPRWGAPQGRRISPASADALLRR